MIPWTLYRTSHREPIQIFKFMSMQYSGKMVSVKVYLIACFLAAVGSVHGYNFAVHLGHLRGGFDTGATGGAMRGGGLVNGGVGAGLRGNAMGAGGFLGQSGFGRGVNGRAINAGPLGGTAGGDGGIGGSALGGGRGIMRALNGGLGSRARGAVGGVGDVDGGTPGGAAGRGGGFNGGALIGERGWLGASVGVRGTNRGAVGDGGALGGAGGFGDALRVVVLNGGFGGLDGGLTGGQTRGNGDSSKGARSFGDRLNNIDQNVESGNVGSRVGGWLRGFNDGALGSGGIGSNGEFGGTPRGSNGLGGPAIGGLVNRGPANDVDFSGQFGRFGGSDRGVNGLLGSGLKQSRISGGFDEGATRGAFTGGLVNGGVGAELGGPSGFGGSVNGGDFNGGLGALARGATDGSRGADRGAFGAARDEFRGRDVVGVGGLNGGVLADGGALSGPRGPGNVLKVVVVNGGLGGLDGGLTGGVARGVGDSNMGTGTPGRRLESSDPNAEFGNLGSIVGGLVRGLNRGTLGAGGGLETEPSGKSLTDLLRTVLSGLGIGVGDSSMGTGTPGRRLESSDQNAEFGNLGSIVGGLVRGLNRETLGAGGGLETGPSGKSLTDLLRTVLSGLGSGVGDSNMGTGTHGRRLESSDPNAEFGNLGSIVGGLVRGFNRGTLSAGGGLETGPSRKSLTGILRKVLSGLGSVGGAGLGDLGDLGSNGRSGGTSSRFNGGNGLDDPANGGSANGGFANGGPDNTVGLGGVGGFSGGVDGLLGSGFNEGRRY